MKSNRLFYRTYIIVLLCLASVCYEQHIFPYYNVMQVIISGMLAFLFVLRFKDNKYKFKRNYIVFYLLFLLMLVSNTAAALAYGISGPMNFISVPLFFVTGISMYIVLPGLFERDPKLKHLVLQLIIYISLLLSLFSILLEFAGGKFLIWSKPYLTRNASIYYDPNFLANILGVGLLMVLFYKDFSLIKRIVISAIIASAVYLSGSRGGLVAIAGALVVYLVIFSKLKNWKKILLLIIVLIVGFYAYKILYSLDYFRIYQGSNMREEMWTWAAGMSLKSPVFGYGYGTVEHYLQQSGFTNASTHNSFIDFGFSYGLICLALYIYLVARSLIRSIKNNNKGFVVPVLLFMIINSNTILYSFGGVGFSSILYTIFIGILDLDNIKYRTSSDNKKYSVDGV